MVFHGHQNRENCCLSGKCKNFKKFLYQKMKIIMPLGALYLSILKHPLTRIVCRMIATSSPKYKDRKKKKIKGDNVNLLLKQQVQSLKAGAMLCAAVKCLPFYHDSADYIFSGPLGSLSSI